MKKNLIIIIIIILGLCACQINKPITKEEAIEKISVTLTNSIPKGSNVAVIDIVETNNRPAFLVNLNVIEENLLTSLVEKSQKKHEFIERRLVKQAFTELKLQAKDLFDQNNVKKMGKFLKVDYLITGTATYTQGQTTLNLRCLNVENLKICGASNVTF